MKSVSLRSSVAAVMFLITLVALAVSVALVWITDLQRGTAGSLVAAVNSVHLLENAEIDLLAHARAMDDVVRSELEWKIRGATRRAEAHLGSDAEREMLAEASSRLERYFASPTPASLDRSFRQLERLVDLNLSEADRAMAEATWWDRAADWIAGTLALGLLALTGTFLFWFRQTALRPVLDVSRTLRDFAAGNHSVRAPVVGPSELQMIARHVNEMADAIERQREKHLGARHPLRRTLAAQA